MIMQTAESGVVFTVNLFLGRLVRPELALAAFGLLDSLMRVLLSPLRNFIQTVQALVRFRRDVGVIVTFAAIVGGGFAGMMLLFHLAPVRTWALEGVMGLPPHMAEYVTPALSFGFLLALAMACASHRARTPHRGQANRRHRDRLRGAAPDGGGDRGSGHPRRGVERRPHRDVRPSSARSSPNRRCSSPASSGSTATSGRAAAGPRRTAAISGC